MASIAYRMLVDGSNLVTRAESTQAYRKACTFDTCPLDYSYWGYRPSFSANMAFTILFGLSTLGYVGQGVFSRGWLGFTIAMVCGCILEVIGYVGRVLAYNDGFTEVCWNHCCI
jgi:hypothetical protein